MELHLPLMSPENPEGARMSIDAESKSYNNIQNWK